MSSTVMFDNGKDFRDALTKVLAHGPKSRGELIRKFHLQGMSTVIAGSTSLTSAMSNAKAKGLVYFEDREDDRYYGLVSATVIMPYVSPENELHRKIDDIVREHRVSEMNHAVSSVSPVATPVVVPVVVTPVEPVSIESAIESLRLIQSQAAGLETTLTSTNLILGALLAEKADLDERMSLLLDRIGVAQTAHDAGLDRLKAFQSFLVNGTLPSPTVLQEATSVAPVTLVTIGSDLDDDDDETDESDVAEPGGLVHEGQTDLAGRTLNGKWLWDTWRNSVAYNLSVTSSVGNAHPIVVADFNRVLKDRYKKRKMPRLDASETVQYGIPAMIEIEKMYAARNPTYKVTHYFDQFATEEDKRKIFIER